MRNKDQGHSSNMARFISLVRLGVLLVHDKRRLVEER